MAENEAELLSRFRESGSRNALRDLLMAHQDRIYNACFQVLRRAEDTEDAAQEALLKLAEGARSARDADSFRGWTYRVSFRIALDHWRRREAVKNRESRAAMNRPAAPPLDDRERVALFEAMDGLDDRERSLLLEHYFEKVPHADLGERRGVSAVAIWKRIDRAREKLKKTLLGAGFLVASARVSEALEASVPAAAPATLVGEALIGKILAGGLALTATKSSLVPAVVVALVLMFVLSTGGYLLLRTRDPGSPRMARESTASNSGPTSPSHGPVTAAPSGAPDVTPVAEPDAKNPLRETLERYRAWFKEWKEASSHHDPNDPRRALRLQYEGFKRFPEARKQIFADIEGFLDFLRDPRNEELVDNLVQNLLGKNEQHGEGGSSSYPQKYGDFPPDLMEGFYGLLKSPGPAQRGILRLLGGVHDVPEKFDQVYEELMYASDPWVQYLALWSRWRQRPLDLPTLEKILTRYESATDPNVRRVAINAISYTPRNETFAWMLDQLESGRDLQSTQLIAAAAATMASHITLAAPTTDRLIRNLETAFEKLKSEQEQNWMLYSALYLPPKDSARLLEAVRSKAVTPKLKRAIESTLTEAAKESATANQLQNHFWRLMKN